MFKFAVALVIFAAPNAGGIKSDVSLNLTPETTITFQNTTEKNTMADCARVAKALTSSKKIAYCGEVMPIDAEPVAEVAPAKLSR